MENCLGRCYLDIWRTFAVEFQQISSAVPQAFTQIRGGRAADLPVVAASRPAGLLLLICVGQIFIFSEPSSHPEQQALFCFENWRDMEGVLFSREGFCHCVRMHKLSPYPFLRRESGGGIWHNKGATAGKMLGKLVGQDLAKRLRKTRQNSLRPETQHA